MKQPTHTPGHQLIVMSGLPGSGKSTLAEAVGARLGLSVFSVDPIESAILKSGITRSFETGLAAYLVAATLAANQFKLGHSVIIDAANIEDEAKEVWYALAKRTAAKLVIVEVINSDKALHKLRIDNRVRGLYGFEEISWERVEARRKVYTDWREPFLTINTAQPLAKNIQTVIAYVHS